MAIANNLNTVYAFGDDALLNLYEVAVTLPKDLSTTTSDKIIGRIQNFNVPDVVQTTYEVHFKSNHLTKAGGKVGSPKEFTFQIRIDKDYKLYALFYKWASLPNSHESTMAIGESENYTGTIQIYRTGRDLDLLNGSDDKNKGFEFHNCWVSTLEGINFDYTSGEPVAVTVTVQFSDFNLLDADDELT